MGQAVTTKHYMDFVFLVLYLQHQAKCPVYSRCSTIVQLILFTIYISYLLEVENSL